MIFAAMTPSFATAAVVPMSSVQVNTDSLVLYLNYVQLQLKIEKKQIAWTGW